MSSAVKYESCLAEELAFHKASIPPTDMPSCTNLFDKWAQCFSLAHQIKAVYRTGHFNECKDKLDNFKFCLTQKGSSKEERYEAYIQRRAEQSAAKRLSQQSSENIWSYRYDPLTNAASGADSNEPSLVV